MTESEKNQKDWGSPAFFQSSNFQRKCRFTQIVVDWSNVSFQVVRTLSDLETARLDAEACRKESLLHITEGTAVNVLGVLLQYCHEGLRGLHEMASFTADVRRITVRFLKFC